LGGAGIGLLIGQSFNGTTLPLVLGFAATSCVALMIVFLTERGRLFRAHHVRPMDIAQSEPEPLRARRNQ
jgi:DHA1 family bicyclomycin/chloramphenicol resistance-like MFS transporter